MRRRPSGTSPCGSGQGCSEESGVMEMGWSRPTSPSTSAAGRALQRWILVFHRCEGSQRGWRRLRIPHGPRAAPPCSRSTALFVKSRPKAPPAGCGSVTGRVTSDLRGHSSSPEHGPAKASPLPTGTRSAVTLREGPAAPASLLSADDTSCFPQRCPEPRKELPSVTQPGQTLPADTSVVFDTCPGRGSLLIIIPRILSSPRLREISGGFAQRGSLFGAQGF